MRIYAMTATFGKLEHDTLTLKPGFHVIQAPNEWGKSTWCAFLMAMFYGLETRAKSTKTSLADKERYAPWSGSPMAGRIDLNWQGKNITIERKTKGRVPMGDFRAYETDTGLPVPELNGANCGQVLLGVERSVFLRSGFIRLSDLPMTSDEALRRRLNALVTTGDESSDGDRLAKGLKDLKNRIRYHRSGLLPQAEAECATLEAKLAEIHTLRRQMDGLEQRIAAGKDQLRQLENHQAALAFAAAEADATRVAEARQLRDAADRRLQQLDALCGTLPDREQLQRGLAKLAELEQLTQVLDMEEKRCDGRLELPDAPAFARGVSPKAALEKALADREQYEKQRNKKPVLLILGMLLVLGGFAGMLWQNLPGLICGILGAMFLLAGMAGNGRRRKVLRNLEAFYGSMDPENWVEAANAYWAASEQAEETEQNRIRHLREIAGRRSALEVMIAECTQGKGLQACRQEWGQALSHWEALSDAKQEWQRAENQLQTVKAMARTAVAPAFADALSFSPEETARRLSEAASELRKLETALHQYAGRIEALGNPAALERKLEEQREKQKYLEEAYGALTIAQETLMEARMELQRRFAPRISKRAAALMARMTGGRYDRLQLDEDFSLLAGAEQEDTLREALWRSEGTLDQLYLSLRIAVAEAVAPDAPLILDDALVRFDDVRLKAAMEILQEEAETKQVILFTCQSREALNLSGKR